MVMVSGAGGLQEKGGRSPPPKRGRLGGGRYICDTLLSPSACSTEGFFVEKRLSYPAQQGERKGFVKGESVPLDRVLVSFAGAKETPRRRAVQIMITKRLAPPIGEKKPCPAHLPEGGQPMMQPPPRRAGAGRYFAAGEIIPCLNGVGVVIL